MYININSLNLNGSLADGPGIRIVVFLQGCDIRCHNCHNKQTWDETAGTLYDIKELADILKKNSSNKKITISGGEPLLQKEAISELLKYIEDWDICLYTGHNLNEIPDDIIKYLKYVKIGSFDNSLKTTTEPFIGSLNQKFINLKGD
ncbi:4Fe-4S single cluster domain-containing protein [uncultured Brachyspira sp.]|uniref:4Fe-4S single cluster domain-containing protein n=1 Tax=uncultured Brachyspira sp. TaxID=221953 RepID=UPI0026259563|nr:4Fe-4S single cluster domain-containing protein [uncultured Brachyspira sp.]